uniref:LEM domain-containing protein n=1 Tax=Anopheles atroparvus TaxID=41427 RepID=A0AAG5DLG4_ANOAO
MSRAELHLALCLIDAIEDANLEALGLLLTKHKANPNTMLLEKDVAPMHLVVGAEEAVFAEQATELMLQHGGDPNLPTEDQMLTPLHAAASIGRVGVVRLLLAAGGNVERLDEDDRTPIQHAIEEGHFAVVRLIQDHVFEKKIERKRKQLLLEQQHQGNHPSEHSAILSPSIMRHMKSYAGFLPATHSTRLQASTVSALQQLEERTLTPNKIHYNFDVTSPYYVNITHRRKDRHKPLKNNSVTQELFPAEPMPDRENISPVETHMLLEEQQQQGEMKEREVETTLADVFTNKRTNLFELTERNLENFTRNDESIGRRTSFIESWREKIADIRDRSSVSRRLDDIDRILNSFSESKVSELEETFVTAAEHPSEETVIVQLSEEYLHTDDEAGVIFREKKMMTAPMFAMPAAPPRAPVPIPKLQVISEGGKVIFEQSMQANGRTGPPPAAVGLNQSLTSQSTAVTLPPMDYDTDALRAELTNYGEPPGPITKHTKKLYLRKLIKFRRHPERLAAANTKGSHTVPNYSVELLASVRKEETFKNILDHQCLEHEMTSEFLSTNSKTVRNFREGHLKKSFIYLLLDPRLSDNLPAQQKHLPQHELWRRFLASIFYVGKGKSSRPYSHLYDAMKLYHQRDAAGSSSGEGGQTTCSDPEAGGGNLMIEEEKIIFQSTTADEPQRNHPRGGDQHIRRHCQLMSSKIVTNRTQLAADSQKLNRIIDVWCAGKGVVCLHVFHNVMPAEAYTREAAIIDALGLQNLTNQKRGDYYGQSVSWPMKKRKLLGILLLYKAMLIFLAEGETQLLPSDLI